MPLKLKISGVLQIFLKRKEENLSGVLQIKMNAEEEKISGVLQILKNALKKEISGVLQIMHLESTFCPRLLSFFWAISFSFWNVRYILLPSLYKIDGHNFSLDQLNSAIKKLNNSKECKWCKQKFKNLETWLKLDNFESNCYYSKVSFLIKKNWAWLE